MIRASDLIGCVVRSESGDHLGHVHDLRARPANGGWELEGLVVGRGGMVARMTGSSSDAVVRGDLVPWGQITRLDEGVVSVRDRFEP
jgi:sporulation protein YlmC with PRC-barrel domain